MSHHRSLVALLATFAVLVAIPATASAKSSAKTGTPVVKAQVVKAKKALRKFKVAVKTDNAAVAATQLKAARRHTAAASKTARKMASRASTGKQNMVAAQALTIAGTQYDALLESITALVDEITGHVQAVIAQAIPSAIAGTQKIIEALTAVLQEVPATIQPMLASIIAALSAGDADPIVNLDQALDSGSLMGSVTSLVSECLAMATQALDMAFATIESILPMLPEVIQGPLSTIFAMVGDVVGSVVPGVLSTVTGLIDQILGSLPFVGSSEGGLFGGLLGGIIGGDSGSTGGLLDIGGLLSGLFGGSGGGEGGSAPGGIGGIISSVTGMISSLLGSLLGGFGG